MYAGLSAEPVKKHRASLIPINFDALLSQSPEISILEQHPRITSLNGSLVLYCSSFAEFKFELSSELATLVLPSIDADESAQLHSRPVRSCRWNVSFEPPIPYVTVATTMSGVIVDKFTPSPHVFSFDVYVTSNSAPTWQPTSLIVRLIHAGTQVLDERKLLITIVPETYVPRVVKSPPVAGHPDNDVVLALVAVSSTTGLTSDAARSRLFSIFRNEVEHYRRIFDGIGLSLTFMWKFLHDDVVTDDWIARANGKPMIVHFLGDLSALTQEEETLEFSNSPSMDMTMMSDRSSPGRNHSDPALLLQKFLPPELIIRHFSQQQQLTVDSSSILVVGGDVSTIENSLFSYSSINLARDGHSGRARQRRSLGARLSQRLRMTVKRLSLSPHTNRNTESPIQIDGIPKAVTNPEHQQVEARDPAYRYHPYSLCRFPLPRTARLLCLENRSGEGSADDASAFFELVTVGAGSVRGPRTTSMSGVDSMDSFTPGRGTSFLMSADSGLSPPSFSNLTDVMSSSPMVSALSSSPALLSNGLGSTPNNRDSISRQRGLGLGLSGTPSSRARTYSRVHPTWNPLRSTQFEVHKSKFVQVLFSLVSTLPMSLKLRVVRGSGLALSELWTFSLNNGKIVKLLDIMRATILQDLLVELQCRDAALPRLVALVQEVETHAAEFQRDRDTITTIWSAIEGVRKSPVLTSLSIFSTLRKTFRTQVHRLEESLFARNNRFHRELKHQIESDARSTAWVLRMADVVEARNAALGDQKVE